MKIVRVGHPSMRRAAIILFIIFGASHAFVAKEAAFTPIEVLVVDPDQHVIPGALVTFESEQASPIRGRTTEAGLLEAALPPGQYALAVDHPAFCLARRSRFNLSRQPLKFHIQLLPCDIVHELELNARQAVVGERLRYTGGYGYEGLLVNRGPCIDQALVAHGGKRVDGRVLRFSPLRRNDREYPVVITYDNYTFTGQAATFTQEENRLVIDGPFTLSDGKRTRKGKWLSVTFSCPSPAIRSR